jgi:hypothetical protein
MAPMKRGNRWYDQYPPLAALLDQLKERNRSEILRIVRGLRDVIIVESPGLIDRTVFDYPLERGARRRWYDFDPVCWLTINAMRYCDEHTIVQCMAYLRESLGEQAVSRQ